MKNINERREYRQVALDEKSCPKNPLELFGVWYQKAEEELVDFEPHAFVLSTLSARGGVASRVLLLRRVDENGFIFYTNYQSEKGMMIEKSPQVAMNFFWQQHERQVRIEGRVEKIPDTDSDKYFQSRPHESRIGAWASNQSKLLKSRQELEKQYQTLLKKYPHEIQRPKHWGGYRVIPNYIEFWQGRSHRLHDRIVFERKDDGWKKFRLAP